MSKYCCSSVEVVYGPDVVDTVGGFTYKTISLCKKCKRSFKEYEGHNGYSFSETDYSETLGSYKYYITNDSMSDTILKLKDLFGNDSIDDDEIECILNDFLDNSSD